MRSKVLTGNVRNTHNITKQHAFIHGGGGENKTMGSPNLVQGDSYQI